MAGKADKNVANLVALLPIQKMNPRSGRSDLTMTAGKRPVLHVQHKLEAIDIDTPEDWALAEAVAQLRSEGRVLAR